MIHFENTYQNLPSSFFAQVSAATVSNPELLAFNLNLAQTELGLDLQGTSDHDLAAFFTGQQTSSTSTPIALAYAGHQFGSFNPQLGDGRAILLGEILNPEGKRFDLQLKGSGRTPFSRNGDGKSAIGPVIREYIVSEAMHSLGVPTTRALAAATTGDLVYRERPIAGAILTRVASSHIRIGTFEYFAAKGDLSALQHLVDYCIDRHYPQIKNSKNIYLALLGGIAKSQAVMVSHWMSFGFIHGVMNTDNMLISGETIDYGPCAFMDNYAAKRVFSSIDIRGRYNYSNQMNIAKWNLTQLANCLLPLIHRSENESIRITQKALNGYFKMYEEQWLQKMGKKLGIFKSKAEDKALVEKWLQYLEEEDLDFTLSFRKLGSESASFIKTPTYQNFYQLWQTRLEAQPEDWQASQTLMNDVNPLFIPRNHQIERAIQAAEKGDISLFKEMNQLLETPYQEQPAFEEYKAPPKPEERIQATFCGT